MNHDLATIPRLHVGAGTTVHSLTVFPVWVEGPSVRGLHWSGSRLSISELDDGPSVSQLKVTNGSSRPAVLLEGDLVEGGWQNRMLAVSALIPAGASSLVPARCVEQGRWDGQARHQAAGQRATYSVRAARRTTDGLLDQGDVWQRIGRFEELHGRTPSASLTDHLRRLATPRMPVLEGQRGVIIGIGGQVVAAEIFGRYHGLVSRWHGIIAAAWLDARRAPSIATPAEQARAFVRRIGPVPLRPADGAGPGLQLVARRGPLTLHGLVHDAGSAAASQASALLHLSALDTAHPYVLAA